MTRRERKAERRALRDLSHREAERVAVDELMRLDGLQLAISEKSWTGWTAIVARERGEPWRLVVNCTGDDHLARAMNIVERYRCKEFGDARSSEGLAA